MASRRLPAGTKDQAILFRASLIEFRMMSLGTVGKIRDTVFGVSDMTLGLGSRLLIGRETIIATSHFSTLCPFNPFSSLALTVLPQMSLLRVHKSDLKQSAWGGWALRASFLCLNWNPQLPHLARAVGGAQDAITLWLLLPHKPRPFTLGQRAD